MNFKPLSNRVLVKKQEAATTTASGLHLPTQNQRIHKGEIVACGKGAVTMSGDLIPMEVSVGDVVVFSASVGSELDVDGKTYIIMHETDLMGVL